MDIEFGIEPSEVHQDSEIRGTVDVAYRGRYDGVVINTLISDSNEHIIYKSYNGKPISRNVSRLFVSRDEMPDNRAEFTALIGFKADREHEVKFRASVIEQHKEIASKSVFATYSWRE